LDSFSRPFGEEYPETGVGKGYCPKCDAILEVWGRGKGTDGYEISFRRWRWNAEHTAVETTDPIFDSSEAANTWGVENMTTFAKEKAQLFAEAKWKRDLIGARHQDDDPRFTVSIPKECANQEELEALIKGIREKLRNQRAGRLEKREDLPDRTDLHFEEKGSGSYLVELMWEAGKIPAPVTIWGYNDGRRYPKIAWNYTKSAPSIHPSYLPADERPKPIAASDSPPRLRKTATVEEALDWLCSRLEDIAADHAELTDTAIRDNIGDTLDEGFLRPRKGVRIPRAFGMDARDADRKIHRVLTSFIKVATPAADARALSPQQRLNLMNQRPFGDLSGYRQSV
jgi:hypothetical protein